MDIFSGVEAGRPPCRGRAGVTLPEVILVIAAAVLVIAFALPQWRVYRAGEHTDAMRDALRRLAVPR